MLDKEILIKQINEMSVEEVQELVSKALEDSGIEYSMDGDGISLSEFFELFPDNKKS